MKGFWSQRLISQLQSDQGVKLRGFVYVSEESPVLPGAIGVVISGKLGERYWILAGTAGLVHESFLAPLTPDTPKQALAECQFCTG